MTDISGHYNEERGTYTLHYNGTTYTIVYQASELPEIFRRVLGYAEPPVTNSWTGDYYTADERLQVLLGAACELIDLGRTRGIFEHLPGSQ